MSTQPKLTEREVRFARYFLHALHANESNGYLLLAVIAWMRGVGGLKWVGNNPLLLRTPGGTLLRYGSLASGALATVKRLLAGAQSKGFAAIILSARRSADTSLKQVTQAQDFLLSLAYSEWDAKHFGMQKYLPRVGEYVLDTSDPSKNTLVPIWTALTGQKIPPQWFLDYTTQPGKQPKPPFQQKRSGYSPIPPPDYIQPYAVVKFYEGRPHLDAGFILTD